MSFSATPDRPVPHPQAYTIDLRWGYIEKHLERAFQSVVEPRCGHLAATYGGGMISKSDILQKWHAMNELGGSAK